MLTSNDLIALGVRRSPQEQALALAHETRALILAERDHEDTLSGLASHRPDVPFLVPGPVPVLPRRPHEPTDSEREAQAWIDQRKVLRLKRRGRRVLRVYSLT